MSYSKRVCNQPDRFGPESKEYQYKNDRFDNSYDPDGSNVFWGIHQTPNIHAMERYNHEETESDIEFIASDTETIEYENISNSSEEELTDSEYDSEYDSELDFNSDSDSIFSDSEYEPEYELNKVNLKRLSSNIDNENLNKKAKY